MRSDVTLEPKSTTAKSLWPANASLMNVRELLDLANIVTLTGLSAAISSALLAINGQVPFAVVALMVAGVCDLFDGFVARRMNRTQQQKEFGGNLDSVVDACSFGFAPVVLVYAAGINDLIAIPLLIFFAICVVWRLACFDTVGLQGEGSKQYFVGLPVTYVAMFLPLAFLGGFWSQACLNTCVCIAMIGLSFSMISTCQIRKPSGIFYLIFPSAAVALAVVFILFADRFVQ